MRIAPLALFSLLLLTACPDDDDGGTDSGTGDPDAGVLDAKAEDDAGNDTDAGDMPDTGDMLPDSGGMDASDDGGVVMPGETLFPGVGVLIEGNMIQIGADTFDSVNQKLANIPRMRQTQDSVRSYEYTFPSYVVTIWYANTNLDNDGAAPMDVDGTDEVLWIAVEDGFEGTTPDGIGLASNRTEVEAAYGAPPHTVAIQNPAGTLAQYYMRGLLVAYDPDGEVRTITISRSYPIEPDGTIDPTGARVRFGQNEIKGFINLGSTGTSMNNVRNLLGEPDAEGEIMVGGTELRTLSYGFFGIEVFFTQISNNALFVSVHPPFYGTTANGLGFGSSHADMAAYLTGLGYTETQSPSNPLLYCYEDPNDALPSVGVTYTMQDDLVSSVTLALPTCP